MAKKEREAQPCYRCGNMPGEKDEYCILCGAPLRNMCTDCSHENPQPAAYCAKCGEPTVFQRSGLVAPYDLT